MAGEEKGEMFPLLNRGMLVMRILTPITPTGEPAGVPTGYVIQMPPVEEIGGNDVVSVAKYIAFLDNAGGKYYSMQVPPLSSLHGLPPLGPADEAARMVNYLDMLLFSEDWPPVGDVLAAVPLSEGWLFIRLSPGGELLAKEWRGEPRFLDKDLLEMLVERALRKLVRERIPILFRVTPYLIALGMGGDVNPA